MPPKSKSTPKNGFYYFMLDFKDQQGRKFKSMKDVADAAGPHWSRMPKEQRKPYETRAAMAKNNAKNKKFTSEGIDIDELTREQQEEEARMAAMKEDINTELKMSLNSNRIDEFPFYLIHFNNFCYKDSENLYYPAEVGLLGFTLRDGVNLKDVYHSAIKPGELPLGYGFTAKQHSDETHKLPPPLQGDAENNSEQVFFEIVQFLQDRIVGSKRLPVVYTDEKYMSMVQTILDTWSYNYDPSDKFNFKVYNLQYMFKALKNLVAGGNVWNSDTFSAREIEKDVYCLVRDISCTYHEVTDVYTYCSKAIVTRWAYVICDNCCQDLNITMMQGCHVPATASTARSTCSSVYSFQSSSKKSSRSRMSSGRSDITDTDSMISDTWEVESTQSQISDSDEFSYRPVSPPSVFADFHPSGSSSSLSQESVASYAGALGSVGQTNRKVMPLVRRMDDLDVDERDMLFPVLGRGRKVDHDFRSNSGREGLRGRGPNNNNNY